MGGKRRGLLAYLLLDWSRSQPLVERWQVWPCGPKASHLNYQQLPICTMYISPKQKWKFCSTALRHEEKKPFSSIPMIQK